MDVSGIGKEFLAEMLAQLPEDHRAVVEQSMTAPEAAKALEVLGQGVKRQAEFSRAMDGVRSLESQNIAKSQELTGWYDTNKPLLELGARAKAAGWAPETTGHNPADVTKTGVSPATLPSDVVRTADLDKRDEDAVQFISYTQGLGIQHLQQFGEVLDTLGLVREAKAKGLTLDKAYEAKYGDQLAEARKKASDAEFDRRYLERRAAERKGEHPSFPGGQTKLTGSPLDALEPVNPGGTSGASLDDMIDDYHQLTAGAAR